MKSISVFAVVLMAIATVSCGGGPARSAVGVDVPAQLTVNDITFGMTDIEGGTFSMGKNPAGTKVIGATIHQVVLHGFSIMDKPVTQGLWAAVMGSQTIAGQNPDSPVEMASYDDCVKFARKLSKLVGIPLSLPTEAQWEYAVPSGKVSSDPLYSEWCADYYADSYGDSLMVDPQGSEVKTDLKVQRNATRRLGELGYAKMPKVTFRLVANTETPIPEDVVTYIIEKRISREEVSSNETIKVGSTVFNMIGVAGGTFEMGATKDMDRAAGQDESPVHKVTLKGFEIGQTEVTVGLWKEVMGSLPYMNKELNKPVVNVSWYDCQMFIMKLNQMTGRKFRLPTEAEWEFAARGGNKSLGYLLSGSKYTAQVAAYYNNAASKVMPVKSFMPNELGIYDMSGNAWEWCQDSWYDYTAGPVTDPYYNLHGELRIMRGGSAASQWDACRCTNRSKIPACNVKSTFGLRLAL